MGTFEKGYLGGFSGKVGTAVGSTWKGLNVLRSNPPSKRRGQPSDLQLERQAKFSLMTNFLTPLTDLLNQTYSKSAAARMSGFNKAFSVNSDAITGVFPAFAVDYPKVLLSKGSLPNVTSPAAASTAAGKLTFTWIDNSGINSALSSDLAFVAAYNEELQHWTFIQKAAGRNAGTFTLDVIPFSGKPVQTYIGFMSADRKKVASSWYTGMVNIL
ncbi:MAG TPA: DUF6266 family protein [Puia sp.]|jgi:hypothetical protein|nr:DUF6266 family protein [Puia sp.]